MQTTKRRGADQYAGDHRSDEELGRGGLGKQEACNGHRGCEKAGDGSDNSRTGHGGTWLPDRSMLAA